MPQIATTMNTTLRLLSFCLLVSVFSFMMACQSNQSQTANDEPVDESTIAETNNDDNPAMPDFNADLSDQKAIAIADEVMVAMGGRKNWDNARYFIWDFFGARRLFWDKWNGDVRIENLKNDLKIIVNINEMTGKVFKDGSELTNQDSVQHYLSMGKSIWINDSYWLVMPFKLKDSGVTLKYDRTDSLLNGQSADVLSLTFEGVGDTPQNKYEVFVDQHDNLIKQWAFFREAGQDSASFIRPWDNYQSFGNILLSSNRSDNGGPSNTYVLNQLPSSVFDSWDDVDMQQF